MIHFHSYMSESCILYIYLVPKMEQENEIECTQLIRINISIDSPNLLNWMDIRQFIYNMNIATHVDVYEFYLSMLYRIKYILGD